MNIWFRMHLSYTKHHDHSCLDLCTVAAVPEHTTKMMKCFLSMCVEAIFVLHESFVMYFSA